MTANELKTYPEHYTQYDEQFCSNFDGIINKDVVVGLTMGQYWADYPGWNFYGHVWFDKSDKKWYCKIMRYGSHVDTISGDSPEELVEEVCNAYGYD